MGENNAVPEREFPVFLLSGFTALNFLRVSTMSGASRVMSLLSDQVKLFKKIPGQVIQTLNVKTEASNCGDI
jgi:hypothetical protein